MAGDINLNAVAPCPSCGHCPTCGRGGYITYPQYPWPYQPTIIWTGGSTTAANGTFDLGSVTNAPNGGITLT